jgi:hypothetical protein
MVTVIMPPDLPALSGTQARRDDDSGQSHRRDFKLKAFPALLRAEQGIVLRH